MHNLLRDDFKTQPPVVLAVPFTGWFLLFCTTTIAQNRMEPPVSQRLGFEVAPKSSWMFYTLMLTREVAIYPLIKVFPLIRACGCKRLRHAFQTGCICFTCSAFSFACAFPTQFTVWRPAYLVVIHVISDKICDCEFTFDTPSSKLHYCIYIQIIIKNIIICSFCNDWLPTHWVLKAPLCDSCSAHIGN